VDKKIAPDAIITGLQQDRKRKKRKNRHTHTHRACLCMNEVLVENKTAADATITGLQLDPKEKKERKDKEKESLLVYVRSVFRGEEIQLRLIDYTLATRSKKKKQKQLIIVNISHGVSLSFPLQIAIPEK
jgi:hypothetical protein